MEIREDQRGEPQFNPLRNSQTANAEAEKREQSGRTGKRYEQHSEELLADVEAGRKATHSGWGCNSLAARRREKQLAKLKLDAEVLQYYLNYMSHKTKFFLI